MDVAGGPGARRGERSSEEVDTMRAEPAQGRRGVEQMRPVADHADRARLWLAWVLAHAAGFAAGGAGAAVTELAAEVARPPVAGDLTVPVGLVAGSLAGTLLQGHVVRRWGLPAGRWAAASALGLLAGLAVGVVAGVLPGQARAWGGPFGTIAAVVLPPAPAIGLAQWLVLRRHAPRAGWWVVATPLAWTVSVPVGWAVGLAVGFPAAMVASLALGGFAGGLVGAALLVAAVGAMAGTLTGTVLA